MVMAFTVEPGLEQEYESYRSAVGIFSYIVIVLLVFSKDLIRAFLSIVLVA